VQEVQASVATSEAVPEQKSMSVPVEEKAEVDEEAMAVPVETEASVEEAASIKEEAEDVKEEAEDVKEEAEDVKEEAADIEAADIEAAAPVEDAVDVEEEANEETADVEAETEVHEEVMAVPVEAETEVREEVMAVPVEAEARIEEAAATPDVKKSKEEGLPAKIVDMPYMKLKKFAKDQGVPADDLKKCLDKEEVINLLEPYYMKNGGLEPEAVPKEETTSQKDGALGEEAKAATTKEVEEVGEKVEPDEKAKPVEEASKAIDVALVAAAAVHVETEARVKAEVKSQTAETIVKVDVASVNLLLNEDLDEKHREMLTVGID